MKKSELIDLVAEKTGLSKADATKAVNATVEAALEGIAKNEEVDLGSLGKVKVTFKQERDGRNPSTGEKTKIAAKYAPSFKFGKAAKDAALSIKA